MKMLVRSLALLALVSFIWSNSYAQSPPDLVIATSLTVTPSSVVPGGQVTLSPWTVKNQGSTASGGFSNGFYLSIDSIITNSDTYLDGNSNSGLAAGAQFNWGGPTLTIPASTASGIYYVGILVDRANEVYEGTNENNNYVFRQITVGIPRPYTDPATNITSTSATLNGRVNPMGAATEAAFEWGTTTWPYQNMTTYQPVGSGTTDVPVSVNLSNLLPNTTYYFRLDAFVSGWATTGSELTFRTPAGCSYSISPTSRSHGYGAETGSVSVTTVSGCTWTATSNASWITIVSCAMDPDGNRAADNSGGFTGSGSLCYSVSANPGPNSRTGTITIAGQIFTVIQAPPPCTYTLSVSTWPLLLVGSPGTVTISPQKSTYCAGDYVTLTATPYSGYTFSSWSGGATGSVNPITIVMNSSKSVTANFTSTPTCTYTLSVSTNPSSGGTVTISPQKSTYCAGDYVTLTATPYSGYTFSSWSGADSSNGPTATVTMNGNRTVTANFQPSSCRYLISSSGMSHGPGAETGSVNVTAGTGCSWTVTSQAGWITITSGSSGSGNGTVNYSVSANPSSNARTGTLTIAGRVYTVTQIGLKIEGFSNNPLPAVSPNWKLYGVHFPSFDTGWAVGHEAASSKGVLLKYKASCPEGCDGQWEAVTPPSVGSNWHLAGVHFTSPDEGWAVGGDWGGASSEDPGASGTATTGGGVLLHYANGSWSSVVPPSVSSAWSLEGVHFPVAGEGWAVGRDIANKKGVLLHHSQGSWGSVAPPDVSPEWELYGIYLLSTDEGWAVGSDASNKRGVLLHYLNGFWSAPPAPSVSSSWSLEGVHFTGSNEGWAVGRDMTNKKGVLLHYVNGFWASVTPPAVSSDWDLESVHFVSSSQGWASGNDAANNKGVFLRYSLGSWSSVAPPDVNSSWGTTAVKCWCSQSWSAGNTGDKGLALQHTDGSLGEKPNLIPYRPKGWSDKILVSTVKGGNTDSKILYNTQNLYVGFAVLNDSQMPIGSKHSVDLYVDGVLKNKDSREWDPLNGCHYGYLKDFPIGSLSVGAHSIRVKVNSTGLINESNAGDNQYERTITVVSSEKANVVLSPETGWSDKMIVSKKRGAEKSYPLTIKDTLYVSWSLKNNGGAKTPGKVTVSVYVDGVKKKSWPKSSMAKSSKWVTKNYSIGKLGAGEHEVKLVVDAESVTPVNEGDQEVVKKINVQESAWEVSRPMVRGKWYLGVDEEAAYTLEGAVCKKGSEVGAVEYYLDWGDGSTAEYWYAAGQSKIHRWSEGSYWVVGKARCKDYPDVQSEPVWTQLSVTKGAGGDTGGCD